MPRFGTVRIKRCTRLARILVSFCDRNLRKTHCFIRDRLRAGAAAVQQEFVCADCIGAHLAEALNSISDHQAQHLVLNDEATFRAFLETKRVDCAVFSQLYIARIQQPGRVDGRAELRRESLLKLHPGDDPCEAFIRTAFS